MQDHDPFEMQDHDPFEMQDHDPFAYLEPDQLLTDRSRPLPRAHLSGRASAALWTLWLFAVVLSAMVIYTFIVELGS